MLIHSYVSQHIEVRYILSHLTKGRVWSTSNVRKTLRDSTMHVTISNQLLPNIRTYEKIINHNLKTLWILPVLEKFQLIIQIALCRTYLIDLPCAVPNTTLSALLHKFSIWYFTNTHWRVFTNTHPYLLCHLQWHFRCFNCFLLVKYNALLSPLLFLLLFFIVMVVHLLVLFGIVVDAAVAGQRSPLSGICTRYAGKSHRLL